MVPQSPLHHLQNMFYPLQQHGGHGIISSVEPCSSTLMMYQRVHRGWDRTSPQPPTERTFSYPVSPLVPWAAQGLLCHSQRCLEHEDFLYSGCPSIEECHPQSCSEPPLEARA